MVLGLYDLDFWHSSTTFPNLELMKIYNYHLQRNDKVIFIKPKSDLGRFNKIIFFKEAPRTIVPQGINLCGQGCEYTGYGFYNQFFPIDEKYWSTPPNYLIYSPFSEKMAKTLYKAVSNNSIIRVENNDFTGLKKNETELLVADYDFINLPNAKAFTQKYQRYKLHFRTFFKPKNEEILLSFLPYENILCNVFSINFPVTFDFFKAHHSCYTNYRLNTPYENESIEHFLNRIIRIIVYYKNENIKVPFYRPHTTIPFHKDITAWAAEKEKQSFYSFTKNNSLQSFKLIDSQKDDLRRAMKMNPLSIKNELIDLQYYL